MLPFGDAEHDEANEAASQLASRETLDVALVIDTTGSMGDEMLYLRTEFLALTASIAEEHPNAEQRWALVVYRDEGDAYVTRSTDFTDDLQAFQSTLAEQSAGGGGDIPEAPDRALAATAELDWRLADDPPRAGFARLLARLGALYREHPCLWRSDVSTDGFVWIDCADAEHSVLAYRRRFYEDELAIVLNLTPVQRPHYRIGVPRAGTWVARLCSDAAEFARCQCCFFKGTWSWKSLFDFLAFSKSNS